MNLIHNKTGETVEAEQYVQGHHPPPKGVAVTMGQHGVLARVTTVAGDLQRMNSGDWILTLPGVGRDIFTDSFVRANYRTEDDEDPGDPDKPLKLG